jgi:hypothetical protein
MVLLPLIRDGIVSLIATALLLSSIWSCHPHCNGIAIIINAQASLPSLQCHVVAVDVQASSPLLQWQLLLLLHWPLCPS